MVKQIHQRSKEEIVLAKEDVLDDLSGIATSLSDSLNLQWKMLQQDLLYGQEEDLEEASEGITHTELTQFALELFENMQQRVTVEIFPGELTDSERKFKLETALTLGNVQYGLVSTTEMMIRRDESITSGQVMMEKV